MPDSGPVALPAPQVPDHVLLRRIGRGSYGEVWLGRSVLGSYRAIKIVYRSTFTEERPFAREFFGVRNFEPISRLNDGLVDVLQVGRNEAAGYFYYVMELADDLEHGQAIDPKTYTPKTLARYLAGQGRIPYPESLRIGSSIASALAELHRHGLIHRDIKPANIVFIKGMARLADIGLVTEARDGLTNVGTEGYTPPEGAGRPSGDLYSLGKVLYEMVTGKDPREFPQLPPDIADMAHSAAILELNEVLLRACEKEPARRYQTAGELHQDLAWLERGFSLRARKARRRRRIAAAMAVPLCAAAVLWWRLPGQLQLSVTPPGASLQIGNRHLPAPNAPFSLSLPAGAHELLVSAPGFESQTNALLLARGRTRKLEINLAHSKGFLEADCSPSGAEIAVDGSSHGSRIPLLPFDTGPHELTAWAPGCFDRSQHFDLKRGESVHTSFSLEQGELWRYTASAFQEARVWTNLDGDGAPWMAVQELERLVLFPASDKDQRYTFRVGGNPLWGFGLFDLGARLDRVLLTWVEESGGLTVTAYDLHHKRDPPLWQWTGATRNSKEPGEARLARVADLNGDGIAELAVAGQDGQLFILDGSTNRPVDHFQLPPAGAGEFGRLDALRRVGDGLAVAFLVELRNSGTDGSSADRFAAGCIRLTDRTLLSYQEFTARCRFIDSGDGQETYLLRWDRESSALVELSTGKVLCEQRLPPGPVPPLSGLLFTLGADTDVHCLWLYPTRTVAQRLTDGTLLWEAPGTVLGDSLPNNQRIAQSPHVLFFWISNRVEAVEPATGGQLWSVPVTGSLLAAACTDNTNERQLVLSLRDNSTEPRRGLLCLNMAGNQQWRLSLGLDAQRISLVPGFENDPRPAIAVSRGSSFVALIRQPCLLWSKRSEGPLQSNPLIVQPAGTAARVIQTGSWNQDQAIVCLDANGAECWSNCDFFPPNRAPALGDWDGTGQTNIVCVGTDAISGRNCVHVFRADDGHVLHCIPIPGALGGEEYCTPALTDLDGDGHLDFVTLCYHPPQVLAINGRTERVMWHFDTKEPNEGALAVMDVDGDSLPDIIAPSADGKVYALSGLAGTNIWSTPIGPRGSRSPPALAHLTGSPVSEVLIVSDAGLLWILDGRTGRPLWNSGSERSLRSASAVAGHPVVSTNSGSPIIFSPLGKGGVVAIDWPGRQVRWRALAGKGVQTSPVLYDLDGCGQPEVVVGTISGELCVLAPLTGTRLFQIDLKERIEADPAIADLNGDGRPDIVVASHSFFLEALDGSVIPSRSRQTPGGLSASRLPHVGLRAAYGTEHQ